MPGKRRVKFDLSESKPCENYGKDIKYDMQKKPIKPLLKTMINNREKSYTLSPNFREEFLFTESIYTYVNTDKHIVYAIPTRDGSAYDRIEYEKDKDDAHVYHIFGRAKDTSIKKFTFRTEDGRDRLVFLGAFYDTRDVHHDKNGVKKTPKFVWPCNHLNDILKAKEVIKEEKVLNPMKCIGQKCYIHACWDCVEEDDLDPKLITCRSCINKSEKEKS